MAEKKKPGITQEELFTALADRTRLRLVSLLGGGEICVCHFVDALGEAQPKISRHLAYLRKSGLVGARRDGKWVHYRLVEPEDPAAAAVLRAALTWLAADPEMQRDRARLSEVCC